MPFSFGFLSTFFYSQLFVTPAYPTHDFEGKTVIVTGSNTGLGFEAARHFARLNCAKLILAVRTTSKGDKAKEAILASTKRTSNCIEVWSLDLSSIASVKAFAAKAQHLDRVDILVENAAIQPSLDFSTTKDGMEVALQTNATSAFLLAMLLLPKLKQTASTFKTTSYLSFVTSELHHVAAFPQRNSSDIYAALNNEKTGDMTDRYPVTKLLQVFLARELAARSAIPPIITAVNPGLCHSELGRDMSATIKYVFSTFKLVFARSTEVGSRTLVAGACAESHSHGAYMADGVNQEPARWISSPEGVDVQRRVFEQTLALLERMEPGISGNVR